MTKDHTNENFPVASLLFSKKNRDVVISYYKVARISDDVADSCALTTKEKIFKLQEIKKRIMWDEENESIYGKSRALLAGRGISINRLTDLLLAFHTDVVGRDYGSWDDLIEYCTYSANPVGRFILDLHDESGVLYQESDSLCSALQIINHMQDCREDFQKMGRVYLPKDFIFKKSTENDNIFSTANTKYLDMSVRKLADRNQCLLEASRKLPHLVRDIRLSMWIKSVHTIATELNNRISRFGILDNKHKLNRFRFTVLAVRGAMNAVISSSQRG